jgi:arylsulfatase A-like enzyme
VPLIIRWPGKVEASSQNDSLIGSVDFAATFVDLANGTLPADMAQDSRSFVPQLAGQPDPKDWRRTMLIEAGNSKGIVSRDWKYVANRVPQDVAEKMKARPQEVFWTGVDHHNYGNEKTYPTYWDADQLFDLSKDVYEQNNLADNPEYAAVLEALRAELSEAVDSLPHTFGEF